MIRVSIYRRIDHEQDAYGGNLH